MHHLGYAKVMRTLKSTIAFALLAAIPAAWGGANAQDFDTQKATVHAETVVDGLEHPWGLDFLPGGDAIVTERPGRMRILSKGKLSKPVEGVPDVVARGQGGLLDVVASPDFASDNLIFFAFSEPGKGGAGTAVVRARLVRDQDGARLEDMTTIFSMARKTRTSHHFGSRLVFAPDGTLFITTGDRGRGQRAQDMQDSAGAILRVGTDGQVPADNPYAEGSRGLPQLWSKGHRNVQGAIFDPVTESLVTAEHGAKGGDEINRPEAGKNYGWPVVSYGVDYSGDKIGMGTSGEGYEQPLYYWDPSIAPSGLAVYQGEMFPEWNGDLLVGSLKFALVSRLERDEAGVITGEERMFEGEFGRIRDINLAPDGSVWLLTDEDDGAIIRLSRGD
ncbi:PQQ-dependent sugar dehydrogenase [Pseudaminobacter sp. NGMCC 1.201702]|uniref:PQQ-dependent sugar dehydrogenase n=1 Tax=Pseudaminobacter sp. NGMCC 1.201702 TaxID=3391825 RepID=UPI0039EE885B